MDVVRRALSYIKPYRGYFALSFFLNIFYALLSVVAISMMIPVLNILFNQEIAEVTGYLPLGSNPLEWGDILKNNLRFLVREFKTDLGEEKALLVFSVIFIVLFLFRNAFRFSSQYFFQLFKTGAVRDLRIETHNKVLRLPVSYFEDQRKGDVISRLSNDVNQIEGSIFGSFIEILRSPVNMLIVLFSLFMYSAQMTLFTLIIFPIMGFLISTVGRSLKRNSTKAQMELGTMFSYIDESVMGASIIKIFNASSQIAQRFNESANRLRRYLVKVVLRKELASPMSELLGAITIALIVYYGGILTIKGEGLRPDEFIAYIGLFYTIIDPIKSLAKGIAEIQKGQISAQRVFDVLDESEVIVDKPDAVSVHEFKDSIVFENLSFAYGETPVIKNFNLRIPKGKTVALIGQSGSGKSTLAQLLTRFFDPQGGSILLDGRDIRDIKIEDYRSLFGMVTQKSILFNDTISNNISLGISNPDREAVVKAAKVANAHRFIEEIPKQYDANIGDSGAKLSGGQQQRLCIARAVMKNPPIMVLDEATSALDTESEKLVQDALDHLLEDRTSLVIAHRLSTIQNADLIVVMDKGEIVEQGTHSELVAKNGMYKKYIELQNLEK